MFYVSAILHVNGYNARAMGLDFADDALMFAMYYWNTMKFVLKIGNKWN